MCNFLCGRKSSNPLGFPLGNMKECGQMIRAPPRALPSCWSPQHIFQELMESIGTILVCLYYPIPSTSSCNCVYESNHDSLRRTIWCFSSWLFYLYIMFDFFNLFLYIFFIVYFTLPNCLLIFFFFSPYQPRQLGEPNWAYWFSYLDTGKGYFVSLLLLFIVILQYPNDKYQAVSACEH